MKVAFTLRVKIAERTVDVKYLYLVRVHGILHAERAGYYPESL